MSESPELTVARKRAAAALKDYQDELSAFLAVNPYPPTRSPWQVLAEHQRRKKENMRPWIRELDRARNRVGDIIRREADQ